MAFAPAPECYRPYDTYGEVCVKCGECGRRFNRIGYLVRKSRQERDLKPFRRNYLKKRGGKPPFSIGFVDE